MILLPDEFSQLVAHDATSLAVFARESKHREFKQDFVASNFSEYAKILASFANTDGGVLIFGVTDSPREVCGATLSNVPDEAKWVDRLREDFDPEIVFHTRSYNVAGKKVFAVAVARSARRPVICRKMRSKQVPDKNGKLKDVEILRDGAVYYRYAGQTRPIGYSELVAILDDREEKRMQALLQTLKVIDQIGVENAGVIDLSNPQTGSHLASLYVSSETAKSLNFVRKGQFTQDLKEGSSAFVVLGEVNLNKVISSSMDDSDKNLPGEVATLLMPTLAEIYGEGIRFSASQVTLLLRCLKIDGDPRFCVQEKKLRRKYITKAGIAAVEKFLRSNPLEALKCFSSRAAVASYEQRTASTLSD